MNKCYLCETEMDFDYCTKRINSKVISVCAKCAEDSNFETRLKNIVYTQEKDGEIAVVEDTKLPEYNVTVKTTFEGAEPDSPKIDENGFKCWYKDGKLHRLDGPAVEGDGYKEWHQDGKLHRLDGPAIEGDDGYKMWLQNGMPHRLDGPARVEPDGSRYWLVYGLQHRLGAPAVELSDGSTYWFQNGKRHRLDGPAIEDADGRKEWWINGIQLSEEEFNEHMNQKCSNDPVNHPSHYTMGGIEVIDAIEAWDLGPHEANVIKYVARAKYKKDELEDLKKARWYLERKISVLEKKLLDKK